MSSYLIACTGRNVTLASEEAKAQFKRIDAEASKQGKGFKKAKTETEAKAKNHQRDMIERYNRAQEEAFELNGVNEAGEQFLKGFSSNFNLEQRSVGNKRPNSLKKAKARIQSLVALRRKGKATNKQVNDAIKAVEDLQAEAWEKHNERIAKLEAKTKARAEARLKAETEARNAFNAFNVLQENIKIAKPKTKWRFKTKAIKAVEAPKVAKVKTRKAAKAPKAHRRAMELIPSKVAQACMSFLFKEVDGFEIYKAPKTKKARAKAIKRAVAKALLVARRAVVKAAKDAKARIKGAKILAELKLAKEMNEKAFVFKSSFGTFNDVYQRQFARECINNMGLQTAFMSDGNDVVDNTKNNPQTSNTTETVVETENQSMKTDNEERPLDLNKFMKKGSLYFTEFMDSISDSIDSSLLARPSITIKLFPSQDKDLIGHNMRNYHDAIPKITVGASFQWASAFEAQYRQMVDWTAEYVLKTLDNVKSITDARTLVTEKIFPLGKNDIVYVQNLKDASGRKCSDKTVTQCLTKAGYYPVTPGMWLAKSCKWAQNWIASNIGSVKAQRERSRALATTPIQERLDIDKDGNVIPVFVYDFNKFYQLAADGSNQMSHNLKALFHDSIVQSRNHNLLNAVEVNEKQSSGFHGKGLLYRVKAWAVPTETSAGDRIWKLSYEEVEGAVPCIMLDVGNIKGDNAQGIKDAVAELAQGDMLQLNNWGGSKDVKLYKNSENNDVVVLGGIIAKDSDGTSTISWQDTALYSLDTMNQMMDYLSDHLKQKAKAFYSYSGNTLGSIIDDPAFLSAAASLKALNPNTVNKLVFGANQKIKTKYCEQIAMPSTLTVASDKYIKRNKRKMFTHNVDGVDMYGCAIRRTPQLFHQCVLYTHLLTHSMVGNVLKDFKAYLADSKKALTGVSLYVANQFEEWMKDNSLFNGNDYWSSFNGKHIEYAIKAFERMQISFKHSSELIWMSKDNQDLIQADSDGDRILFTVKKELVKWACLHVESIKDLPLIKPEVCPSTPLDGGDKVKLLKTLRPFEYGEEGGEYINQYICAKDGGMGPVGFMINLCSTVLSKIVWSTINGQWNAHQTKNAFKLFGFLVLLVQNGLDRVKKPWLVAALNGWWKVDTSKIIVGGKDYQECPFSEIWPTMGLGKEIRQVASRSSDEEMYNLSGLKLFVTWTINLVKLNYEFNCPEQMMKDINQISLLFANSSDEEPLDWQKVKDVFGNKIDDVSIEKLEAGWVWPDRLYAWKKEASLEIPLSDAPPALNLLAEKVVEIFNEVKEEKGIYEAPYELVRQYLKSAEDTATELKQGVWFCKDLFNALQEIRGLEHDDKATSEYFNAQASYDANKHLKDMKRAFGELSQTDGFVNKIVFMALKGSDVIERKKAVKAFMIVLLRSWHTGYSEWLRLRKPFEWLKETHIDFIANQAAKEKGDSLLSSLLKALKLDKVEKDDKNVGGDKFTDACLKKQATLVEWLQTNPLDPKSIIDLKGFGKAAQAAFTNWLDHSSLADTTKHWTEVLWEEWIPALEIQADLSEEQDDKTSFYHETNLVDSLVELIKNGDDETIKQDLVKQAKLFVISTTNKNKDALSENNAKRLASCIENGNFESGEILNARIGYLFKEGFEKFNKKYLIKMIQPVIAGYRLDSWLDTWDILKTDPEKKEEILTSCLMNQRSYMKTVDGEPQLKVYKTLKSKVIYPVDPLVTANIASAFLEERSFYLLMKQTSIYLSKSVPRVSNAMRWVLWSRPQAKACRDDKNTIYNQLLTGIGIGHCFNVSMLRLIKGIAQDAVNKNENAPMNQLKVDVIENVLVNQTKFVTMTQSETSKELTNDETIKRSLIDNEICLPYHWGGSRKANNSYGRSSPYRSTFRFIFSIFGGPGNNTDQHKELTFQLFTELTSSTFFKKTKKLDVKTMSSNEIQAEVIKKLSAVVSTTHNIVENKGKNKEPRCPWTMPGSYMVVGETAQEWLKPPKSPDREVVGSVEFTNLRILKTYSPKGVFLSYYDKTNIDNAGKPTLMDVKPFREKAIGSATWNATQTSRSITGAKGIKKLNGMDAAWVIASRISNWQNGNFGLVKGADLKAALELSYNADPTHFKRALAEYLLGMLHTTSLIDTFSVSKFNEGEYMLSLRMLTKVPYFLKSFVRSCHGATPNIVLGADVISMLLNQFRGDK